MLSITHPEHLRHILKHFPEKEEIIISRVLLMEPGVVIAAVLYEPEIRGYLNECDISNEIERLIQPGSFYDYDNAISSMLLYKIFQQPDQNVLDFFRLYPQAHDFLLNNKSYEYFLDMFWRFPQISQDRNFREPYIKAIVDNWDHIDFEQFFNKKMSEGFIEGIFVLLVEELSRKQCSDFCTALWKYNPELLLDFIKKYDSTMTGRFETRADEENTKHDKIDLLDMYDQFTSTITPAEIKNFLINYHNLNTSLLGEDEVVSCIEPNAILQLLRFDGLYTIDNYFKRLIECSEISRFDSVTREVYQNFLGQFSDIERAKLFLKYPYACAMLSIHTGDHSFWNFIENEPITETRTEIMGITERYRPKRTQEDANITGQKRGFLNSDSDGSDNENAFFKDTRRRL